MKVLCKRKHAWGRWDLALCRLTEEAARQLSIACSLIQDRQKGYRALYNYNF